MKKFQNLLILFMLFSGVLATSPMLAQETAPDYTKELLQSKTQNLNQHLVDMVIARFDDFSNQELHELVKIAESQQSIKQASQIKSVYDRLEHWKQSNLTSSEIESMPTPSLSQKNQ